MSRTDRYDVTIQPVPTQRAADKLIKAVRGWMNLEFQHGYAKSTRTLCCWGERQFAAGVSWEEAHNELIAIVHKVAPRVEVSSRWWDGDRAPDDQFSTEPEPKKR